MVAFIARSSADEWDNIILTSEHRIAKESMNAGREMQSAVLFSCSCSLHCHIRRWALDVERSAFAFTLA